VGSGFGILLLEIQALASRRGNALEGEVATVDEYVRVLAAVN
jgi:hypothetical protein